MLKKWLVKFTDELRDLENTVDVVQLFPQELVMCGVSVGLKLHAELSSNGCARVLRTNILHAERSSNGCASVLRTKILHAELLPNGYPSPRRERDLVLPAGPKSRWGSATVEPRSGGVGTPRVTVPLTTSSGAQWDTVTGQ